MSWPMNFGKWVMFTHGQLGLHEDLAYFNDLPDTNRGNTLRTQKKEVYLNSHKNAKKYFCYSELKRYRSNVYSITHLSTDTRGTTQTLTFWFKSLSELVDIYECIDKYVFVDTYIELIEFVKECTVEP